jgi:hypothetical protein
LEAEPAIQALWMAAETGLYGVFNVGAPTGSTKSLAVRLPDGAYVDLLSEKVVHIRDSQIELRESAVILRCDEIVGSDGMALQPFYSELLERR